MYTMIVCHLAERASGKPTLGMRYFSADESFLLCSFSLGVRAVTGSPVVTLPSSLFIPLAAFTLACICKLFLSTLRPTILLIVVIVVIVVVGGTRRS